MRWSTETQQRRTELITTLVNDIGIKQVRCEGHFAYIEGSRANHRIHLGSGVTHIQPGNYLCIVPERKKDEPLYLPFADTDLRMAEILRKIFLLVSDDKITDKTILAQKQEAAERVGERLQVALHRDLGRNKKPGAVAWRPLPRPMHPAQ